MLSTGLPQQGKTEVVALLAANKQLLEAKDSRGDSTPLMLAAHFGHASGMRNSP